MIVSAIADCASDIIVTVQVTLYHTSQSGMCASLALHVMQPGNRQTIPFGTIHITPDQLAALSSRTKRLEGLAVDTTKSQGKE
jgi:hypothetical protein